MPVALDFTHFANGAGTTSGLVFVNLSTQPSRPTLYFYDREGQLMDPESVVDLTEDLEVTEDGSPEHLDGDGTPGRTHDFDPRPGRGGVGIGEGGLGRSHRRVPAL